ncbi:hypothetical protein DSO57_1025870 [Entomophthora muscae]|uniref:Uncharacterized protein n=1 Tax=Entomophthora muscae TaxID=34485 RepID=A0ACC2T2N6_9FUNG|nr:hypothetical protein DSO57_1025870 [Entomophthora muscae]
MLAIVGVYIGEEPPDLVGNLGVRKHPLRNYKTTRSGLTLKPFGSVEVGQHPLQLKASGVYRYDTIGLGAPGSEDV